MRRLSSGFVLGYHGCDKDVAEKLLAGEAFSSSQNDYDWLGEGIYFWESNPKRGLEFAYESAKRKGSKLKTPSVIGCALDLGLCLDLSTKESLDTLSLAYEVLLSRHEVMGTLLPENTADMMRRPLDCAVVNLAFDLLKTDGTMVDTVRGIFQEGAPLYPGSGFLAKTHIQIAVRNRDCIKGVFRVSSSDIDEVE